MASDPPLSVVWFRNDLRVHDQPAVRKALAADRPVIFLYILEGKSEVLRAFGGASLWWLHHSLTALQKDIEGRGARLLLKNGTAGEIISELCDEHNVEAVFWTRRYGKAERAIDEAIKSDLKSRSVEVESFNGHLLMEPWKLKTGSGSHYKVFSPFWRALQAEYDVTLSNATLPEAIDSPDINGDALEDWDLLPSQPNWATGFETEWVPGETGARDALELFIEDALKGYKDGRNRPDFQSTSRLSPHLRFGEISPHRIWQRMQEVKDSEPSLSEDAEKFLSELAWRDFSFNLMFHYPNLGTENYNSKFDDFPWAGKDEHLQVWQRGETGYPIVDAGMRELWVTGWMHNRVRMIVASFLTKHLLIDWRKGENWFWDTLVDADPANNTASWQWVAGSGADAAPYFRIFNPMTQGEKFDPEGAYVSKWVPELSKLPTKCIHQPWDAPADVLKKAGVTLGETYPKPIVDHSAARKRALDAYQNMKEEREDA